MRARCPKPKSIGNPSVLDEPARSSTAMADSHPRAREPSPPRLRARSSRCGRSPRHGASPLMSSRRLDSVHDPSGCARLVVWSGLGSSPCGGSGTRSRKYWRNADPRIQHQRSNGAGTRDLVSVAPATYDWDRAGTREATMSGDGDRAIHGKRSRTL